MIRISITPAAYLAIAATLPGNVGVERERAPNGDYLVRLDPGRTGAANDDWICRIRQTPAKIR